MKRRVIVECPTEKQLKAENKMWYLTKILRQDLSAESLSATVVSRVGPKVAKFRT